MVDVKSNDWLLAYTYCGTTNITLIPNPDRGCDVIHPMSTQPSFPS
jgi:hypothetical protein